MTPAPDDAKTTESRPVPQMRVALIGTGDGQGLPSGTVAETPGAHQPNVAITVITPVVAILVRAINTFLTTLVGVITAEATTNVIPWSTFTDMVTKGALVALAPTALGLLKDCITIFGRLEQKFPLATGSV